MGVLVAVLLRVLDDVFDGPDAIDLARRREKLADAAQDVVGQARELLRGCAAFDV